MRTENTSPHPSPSAGPAAAGPTAGPPPAATFGQALAVKSPFSWQFIFYCLIGASGVGLDFATYSLLVKTHLLEYQAANAVGYASGTLLSFALNARFNFRVSDRIALRLLSFFGVAFLGWLASAVTLHVLIGDWSWNKYLSKAATLVVVLLLQYNLNRAISFRKAV